MWLILSVLIVYERKETVQTGSRPADGVAADLQVLEQLLGLLPVAVLLLGRQRVVGDQQSVAPASWGEQRNEEPSVTT